MYTVTGMYTVTLSIQGIYYDMIAAVEAAKQGVTIGEDTVSGLMFADDFGGISDTPEELQKRIEKALRVP